MSPAGGRADEAVMIWRSGPDQGCTYFSPSWLAFTGRTLEEELGDGWAAGVHPEDREQCLEVYQSAFTACREFQMQYRLRRYDGVYRWILDIGTPEWDASGRFQGYVGSCVDITEARRLGPSSADPSHNGAAIVSDQSVGTLTRRERDVLELLARGLSNREIAGELVISVATVRVHVDHILDKLGLHSRAQVAAWVGQHRS